MDDVNNHKISASSAYFFVQMRHKYAIAGKKRTLRDKRPFIY